MNRNFKFLPILFVLPLVAGCKNTSKPQPHIHEYGEPTYTWAADYSTCTAKRFCISDSTHVDQETVQSTYAVITEAHCETEGEGIYTAVFENSAFQTQTHNVILNPIQHNWGVPSYEWNSDYSQCTATRICLRESSHVETETVSSVYTIPTPARYDAEGQGLFTASFENSAFETQTHTTAISMLDDLIFSPYHDNTEYSVKMRADAVVDTIVIPSTYNNLPVTYIEPYAFSGTGFNVKKVVIPSSIISTNYTAFFNNTHIEEVDGVTFFGSGTFEGCTSLKKLVFADSFTSLSTGHLFENCAVEEVVFPGIKTVPGYAFEYSNLKKITFGPELQTIDNYAFQTCSNLEEVNVDPACEAFKSDDGVLYSTSPQRLLEFPDAKEIDTYTLLPGTQSIYDTPFDNVTKVRHIILNEEMSTLSSDAFYNSISIEKVTVTNPNFNSLGERTFSYTHGLKEVEFPSTASFICEDGLIMDKSKYRVYFVCGGYEEEITIPATVKFIGTYYSNVYRHIKCPGFKVEDGNTNFTAENGVLYTADKTTLLRYPYKPNETVFNANVLPSSVTVINHYAFGGFSHVTEFNFTAKPNIERFNFGAFSYCENVTKITLPAGVNYIDSFVFSNCSSLTQVVFLMDKADFTNVYHTSQWLNYAPYECLAVFNDQSVNIYSL